MAKFLLEIGTEELPADFSKSVPSQLHEKVRKDLLDLRLQHKQIHTSSTPRRISLLIDEISDFSDDFFEEIKGPSVSHAFLDGVPTKAAIGFAKRFNIQVCDLILRKTPKGEFVFAKIVEKGKPAKDLLTNQIPIWIDSLQGRRFMRWGNGNTRFSRPIRWLISLLDDEIIPVHLKECDPPISSGRLSRGHRLYSKEISIKNANNYIDILASEGVYVDRNLRLSMIEKLVHSAAADLHARPDLSTDLLEELCDLVETPSILCGSFESSFLELPPEVLCTVMRVHQRYIPLFIKNDINDSLLLDSRKTLLPHFLTISNGLSSHGKNINLGNERVLKARFSDAEFFVKVDKSISSLERCDKLKYVTFSEGLGSLYDRVKRIEFIVGLLLNMIDIEDNKVLNIKRAASLCKHDLVSQLVGEFPELQGTMGGKYLLYEGEEREVALAVAEHYLPRFASDILPCSLAGSILSISDKLELLVSIYSKGDRPTGSSDPYALRRSANGVLQVIWLNRWHLNLYKLLQSIIDKWSVSLNNLNIETQIILDDLTEFFRQRIINLLEENSIDTDIIQSLVGKSISLERILLDPIDIQIRAELLMNLRKSGKLILIQKVVARASRLAKKSTIPSSAISSNNYVDTNLFEKSSEFSMLDILNKLEPLAKQLSSDRYLPLAEELATGANILSEFFDGEQSVMVMTENESVRINRLNLLAILTNQASIIADFSKLSSTN